MFMKSGISSTFAFDFNASIRSEEKPGSYNKGLCLGHMA